MTFMSVVLVELRLAISTASLLVVHYCPLFDGSRLNKDQGQADINWVGIEDNRDEICTLEDCCISTNFSLEVVLVGAALQHDTVSLSG